MLATTQCVEADSIDLARECLYRFLASVLSSPGTQPWQLVRDVANQQTALLAAEMLRDESPIPSGPLGFGELPGQEMSLAPVLIHLTRSPEQQLADYEEVFGLISASEFPPYETEYCANNESFFRAQQLADVAGFFRAFGIEPGLKPSDRPDHICLELEFMAFVLLKKRLALVSDDPDRCEQADVCQQAATDFFRDHLAWWVTAFATGLQHKGGHGVYGMVGRFLAAFMAVERIRLGLPAPRFPLQTAAPEPEGEEAACAQ